MAIDLKKVLGGGSGGGWLVGETRRLPVVGDAGTGILEYNGMSLIVRDAIRAVMATDYPEFYALTEGFYGIGAFATRNPSLSGLTNIASVDANGTTIIVVGNGGKIGRTVNGGVAWSLISVSGITADLKLVHYNPGLAKWFIYYTTNKVLISSDDGATFVDTTVTGLAFTALLAGDTGNLRACTIGNNTVLSSDTKTFVTANGTTYSTPTLSGASIPAGKLTKGNGWFCILTAELKLFCSNTGIGAWTSAIQFDKGPNALPYQYSYGVVYTGVRWVLGLGGPFKSRVTSTYPVTGPAPPPTEYYVTSTTAHGLAYTSGASMANPTGAGSTWNYLDQTLVGGYITAWVYSGGETYWRTEDNQIGVYNGPSESLGSYAVRGVLAPSQWHLYSRDIWETLIANPSVGNATISAPGVASADLTANTDRNIVTNSSFVAVVDNSATFKISTSGSAPSRSLPILTPSGNGEGPSCTRIK